MNFLTIRGVTLGAGQPRVIVPLCEASADALRSGAAALARSRADLIEWRVDALDDARDTALLLALLPELRQTLGDKPLLATCRTRAEGGAADLSPAAYRALCGQLCASRCIDLLDIELSAGEDTVRALVAAAQANGVRTVFSCHDFPGTPPRDEMVRRMCRMQALGADIAKLAVMPQSRRDVAELLAATAEMADLHPETPVITMSMGPLGVVSRLTGEAFGSAATFAVAGRSSAPDQPPLEEARALLEGIHRQMQPDTAPAENRSAT